MDLKQKKIRADELLVKLGLAASRTKAQSLILAGSVYLGTQRIDKASHLLNEGDQLIIKKNLPFVSRGGLKLQAALDRFQIDVKDKICLDVGASTGGFTDCLLKAGAKKVYAVDVGYGQLDWSIRNDPRATVIERTNFRHFDTSILEDPIDLITMDVSFISIEKLISKVIGVFKLNSISPLPQGEGQGEGGVQPTFIALIKPQFEVGRSSVGKKGIVRDKAKRQESVEKIKTALQKTGFEIVGTLPSPILGQEGNQEYVIASIYKGIAK